MKKKQKIERNDCHRMETDALKEEDETSEDDEDQSVENISEEEDSDEIMKEVLEDAEMLDFDFEALPLHNNDKEGIVNMLTQIFLRANVDVETMARTLIQRSPLGCVYLPAEDNADEGNENVVYGLLSILPLNSEEKYVTDLWSLLMDRAKKYALDKSIVRRLESFSTTKNSRPVMLINERLLHFPSTIAKPAFSELISDLTKDDKANDFTDVIIIMKIRIADTGKQGQLEAVAEKGKRKLGKAAKRRLRSVAASNAEVIFDNPEEKLLFQDKEKIEFFQYPVQSDVERNSKFNATVLNGITFRPYRRVCIIDHGIFDRFAKAVAKLNE